MAALCVEGGRRAERDPRSNSARHKDWLSAAADTHRKWIKIHVAARLYGTKCDNRGVISN